MENTLAEEVSCAPRFDQSVPAGGYAWWYVDGLSDDGQRGVTIIGFVGSVFSPYYAWSGRGSPEEHCAMNVAVYEPRGGRWAMTERGRSSLDRSATHLTIGPSSMRWTGEELQIDLAEISCPIPKRIRGRVCVRPRLQSAQSFFLDETQRHNCWPLAPLCTVEVELEHPDVQWQGHGYFDCNWGDQALEDAFSYWSWARVTDGATTRIVYDVERRDRSTHGLALDFDASGRPPPISPPPMNEARRVFWGVKRRGRSDEGFAIRRSLEDSPFYTRSIIDASWDGQLLRGVHESLSLDRFASWWVKLMLPFRMPRAIYNVNSSGR
ncbi:MAG: hypothetical protein AAF658_17695 [Myxococcota bacterium]